MRTQRKSLVLAIALLVVLAGCERSLTSYVDPFVGTGGHGHTFPGAVLPFGAVQLSPDTRLDGWDGCSGYHYSDDTVFGFSHTHLSGTGCSDYGDLLIMPLTNKQLELPDGAVPETLGYDDYKSAFSHRSEKASPGYYRVVLDRNRVMAELTVHGRTGLHRYTYPTAGGKGVVVDLKHRDVVLASSMRLTKSDMADGMTQQVLSGSRRSAAWSGDQHFYFALVADKPIDHIAYYVDGKLVESADGIEGTDCKAVLYFDCDAKEVTLTVGISAVDERGALANLKESYGIAFEKARKEADKLWEKALGKIEVEGGSREARRNFYTALYHCMTSPYLFSDVDGRYRMMNPRSGVKGKAMAAEELDADSGIGQLAEGEENYTVFSVWDTYRALHPLLNLIEPERSEDFVRTMLRHYRRSGELTMWELGGWETHCMIGYHSASVIADALRTGVLDNMSQEELDQLLTALDSTANLPILGRQDYARDGYLSSELENESVSKTLEYAYDDWCIAMVAKALEQKITKADSNMCVIYWDLVYEEYIQRCQSWKNIMDGDGFMHARRNGGFVTPFDPTEVNNHYTEANCWQYSSYVPHDIEGWAAMLGGNEAAIRLLDSLFYGHSQLSGRDQSDITGLIGLYAHGNEPSHHAAYLYACLGEQYRTAELVRKICNELYHSTPDGLCGNEDCGQMSAWYVLSALGFYPVCPGSGEYVIGSPLFDKATIHLPNGKDIVINAKGQGKDNCYVMSLRLNGSDYNKYYLTVEQLKEGCTLDFEMSSTPFAEQTPDPTLRPHSGIAPQNRITPAPVFGDWQQQFVGSADVTITARGNDAVYYTVDGSCPTTESLLYTGPIHVENDIVINARAYNGETGYSKVVAHRMTRLVQDRMLTYLTQPNPQYYENGETGLIDRLHGTTNFRIGGWQGWQGDCEVVIDLLEARPVSRVAVECLESMRAWIFYPVRVEVSVSDDGSSYRPFGSVENTVPATLERQEENNMQAFTVNNSATARYVKVKAVNYGKLPGWHVSAGEQAWLFIDEITVE